MNPTHQLVAAACENGEVKFFDPRSRRELTPLDVGPGVAQALVSTRGDDGPSSRTQELLENLQATTVAFDRDGLSFAVGYVCAVVAARVRTECTCGCAHGHRVGGAFERAWQFSATTSGC